MGYREQFFEDCRAVVGEFRGLSVLVVGCGPGHDCQPFVEAGARVSGLDLGEVVGSGYSHPDVCYYRQSIEACDLPSDRFDVVFCIATMEHVQNIESGFAEMVRVASPGGVVYSMASPLWNSRRGHHMDCLNVFPWIHLRLEREEIVRITEQRGITHNGLKLRYLMDYLFESDQFNRAPARRYVDACRNLPVSQMLRNDLWPDGAEELTSEILFGLKAKGYQREELLATAHALVCRK